MSESDLAPFSRSPNRGSHESTSLQLDHGDVHMDLICVKRGPYESDACASSRCSSQTSTHFLHVDHRSRDNDDGGTRILSKGSQSRTTSDNSITIHFYMWVNET